MKYLLEERKCKLNNSIFLCSKLKWKDHSFKNECHTYEGIFLNSNSEVRADKMDFWRPTASSTILAHFNWVFFAVFSRDMGSTNAHSINWTFTMCSSFGTRSNLTDAIHDIPGYYHLKPWHRTKFRSFLPTASLICLLWWTCDCNGISFGRLMRGILRLESPNPFEFSGK